jgi:hypothetical protein
MKRLEQWPGGLLLVVLSMLLAEGMLQLLSWQVPAVDRRLSPSWKYAQQVPDSVLGWRGNPRWFDHDSLGFRNLRVLNQAEVVTLGDSHTYGIGVGRSEAWPFLIGEKRPLYNMAFGGWGPGQAYMETRQALALHPRFVLFGFYFGNDLVDAFELSSHRADLRRFMPAALRDTTAALEAKDPIEDHAERLFSLATGTPDDPANRSGLRRFLSNHSRLYGLVRALRGAFGPRPPPALLSRDMDQALGRMTDRQRRFVLVYRAPTGRGS